MRTGKQASEVFLPVLPEYEFPDVGHTGGLCVRMRAGRRPRRFVFRPSLKLVVTLSQGERAGSATGRGLVSGLGGLLISPHFFCGLAKECYRLTLARGCPNFVGHFVGV